MARDFREQGVPLIRLAGLKRGAPILRGCNFLDEEMVQRRWKQFRVEPGDVLLSTSASLGEVAVVDESARGAIPYTGIISFRPKGQRILARFIKYALAAPSFKAQIESMGVGSVMRHFGPTHLKKMTISVPPKQQQAAIADVLDALDDKIAVNDRIADTARQLGLAIFQQGLQAADCTYERVGDLANPVVRGVTPRYSEEQDALTVLNQKCIRDGRVSLAAARRTDAEKVPAAKMLKKNDVVVNSTGVGTLGRVARWTGAEDCTVDSHVTIIRFDENKIDPVGAGFAMLLAQPEIERLGEGSTGQTELNRAKLASLVLRLPRREWLNSVRPKLEALESRGDAALAESVKLAKLRDTLLPKLMSGEIRVRDAEREVENAL